MKTDLRPILAAMLLASVLLPAGTAERGPDPWGDLPNPLETPLPEDPCEPLRGCEFHPPECVQMKACVVKCPAAVCEHPCLGENGGCVPCPNEVCQPCGGECQVPCPVNDCSPECPEEVCQNPCLESIGAQLGTATTGTVCGIPIPSCPEQICQNPCLHEITLDPAPAEGPGVPEEVCGFPVPECEGERCQCTDATPLLSDPITAALAYSECVEICMEESPAGGSPTTDSPDDSGTTNPGLLDGYATWYFGILGTKAMPCGSPAPLATPFVPGGADLGGFVVPPFELPYMDWDHECDKLDIVANWRYDFGMKIDVHDARYVGELPGYPAMGSVVSYEIADKTFIRSELTSGYSTKEGCEAARVAKKVEVANDLLNQANAYVKSKPWDVHGEVHYLRDAAGGWTVRLPGRGDGVLDYRLTMGSVFLTIGTEAFEFDAAYVIAQQCTPATVNPQVCAQVTVTERSESII